MTYEEHLKQYCSARHEEELYPMIFDISTVPELFIEEHMEVIFETIEELASRDY